MDSAGWPSPLGRKLWLQIGRRWALGWVKQDGNSAVAASAGGIPLISTGATSNGLDDGATVEVAGEATLHE